jgi:hypothetical protein
VRATQRSPRGDRVNPILQHHEGWGRLHRIETVEAAAGTGESCAEGVGSTRPMQTHHPKSDGGSHGLTMNELSVRPPVVSGACIASRQPILRREGGLGLIRSRERDFLLLRSPHFFCFAHQSDGKASTGFKTLPEAGPGGQ